MDFRSLILALLLVLPTSHSLAEGKCGELGIPDFFCTGTMQERLEKTMQSESVNNNEGNPKQYYINKNNTVYPGSEAEPGTKEAYDHRINNDNSRVTRRAEEITRTPGFTNDNKNEWAQETSFWFDRGVDEEKQYGSLYGTEVIEVMHAIDRLEMLKFYSPFTAQAYSEAAIEVATQAQGLYDIDTAPYLAFGLPLPAGTKNDHDYCGMPEIAGGCIHISSLNIPYLSWFCEFDDHLGEDIELFYGYRFPVAKGESARPGSTAYKPKTEILEEMMDAREVYKEAYEAELETSLRSMFTRSLKYDWGIKPTDENGELTDTNEAVEQMMAMIDEDRDGDLTAAQQKSKEGIVKMMKLLKAATKEDIDEGEWDSETSPDKPLIDRLKEDLPDGGAGILALKNKSNAKISLGKDEDYYKLFMRTPLTGYGTGVILDTHIMDTGFHDEFKDLDIFNGFEENEEWTTPHNWLHNGAELVEYINQSLPLRKIQKYKDKIKVGEWNSEYANSIIRARHHWPNLETFGEEMFDDQDRGSCRAVQYAKLDGGEYTAITRKTPIDILLPCNQKDPEQKQECMKVFEERKRQLDDTEVDQRCFPDSGMGEKLGPLGVGKTYYNESFASIGFYRVLRDMLARGEEEGQETHQLQEIEENPRTNPNYRPRDYAQFVFQRAKKYKGCGVSKSPDSPHWVNRVWGMRYENRAPGEDLVGMDWDKKYNARYVGAHWRYVQTPIPSKFFGQDIGVDCYLCINLFTERGDAWGRIGE